MEGIVIYNRSIPSEKNRVIYQRLKSLASEFSITLLTEPHLTYPEEIRKKANIKTPPINFLSIPLLNNQLGKFLQHIFFKIWVLTFILGYKSEGTAFIYTFAQPPAYIIGMLAKSIKGHFWILEVMHSPLYHSNLAKQMANSLEKYYWAMYGPIAIGLARITMPYADLVLATSHTNGDGCSRILRERFGVNRERLLPIQQGSIVSREEAAIGPVKKRDEYIDMMYVGEISRTKGFLLLYSFNKLLQNIPNLRLTVVGPVEPEYINQFGSLANGRIRFLGRVEHREALDYVSEADLCVCTLDPEFPDNHYAQPVKLLEYLAYGKPVIATNLEGIRGFVEDGVNGFLYEPGSVDSFVRSVTKLATSPEVRTRLSVNAKESIKKYDWELVNRKVMGEIRSAISKREER